MTLIKRALQERLKNVLERKKSVLLLGPRQTGKTTLVKRLKTDVYINLAQPDLRQAYEKDLGRLTREVHAMKEPFPLIVIDEIQKVPPLLDAIQDIIDSKRAQFILTGSSARKLRRDGEANLLPGRVVVLRMDPLMINEIMTLAPSIEDLLLYGSLPEIFIEKSQESREEDLFSYVTTYLEEEIRAEALVRNIGAFSNFLKLAALESGLISNFHKLSQDIGVSVPTIGEYYQILVDCLVAEKIEPLIRSRTRKRLIKSPKFLFYDLGVRRIAAGEGKHIPEKYMGDLFEQWVGLELLRQMRTAPIKSSLLFWRDSSGVEVDWVIERNNQFIPIEVKWTENPRIHDARHVQTFVEEYQNAEQGYVVCRVNRAQQLTDSVTAIAWQDINTILD